MFSEFFAEYNIPTPTKPLNQNGFTKWGGNNNNRYSAKLIGDDGIYLKDFVADFDKSWFPKRSTPLSSEEIQKRKAIATEAKKEADAIQRKQHEEAAIKASNDLKIYSKTGNSPYLERKKIKGHGEQYGTDNIAIPMHDIDGKFWNFETIPHDGGVKKGQFQAKRKGCFHVIGDLPKSKEIFVAEGFATAASVYEATNITTIAAFTAGNLDAVVSAIKLKYPEMVITIAADNDAWGEVNTGKIKAKEAALMHGINYILPIFRPELAEYKPTDFNDLHVHSGIDEVQRQLSHAFDDVTSVTDVQPNDSADSGVTDYVTSPDCGVTEDEESQIPTEMQCPCYVTV